MEQYIILCWGLTKRQMLKIANLYSSTCTLKDVTGCIEDLIALNSDIVIINPHVFSETEEKQFRDIFRYDYDTLIIFTDSIHDESVEDNTRHYFKNGYMYSICRNIENAESIPPIDRKLSEKQRLEDELNRKDKILEDINTIFDSNIELSTEDEIARINNLCLPFESLVDILKKINDLPRKRYICREKLMEMLNDFKLNIEDLWKKLNIVDELKKFDNLDRINTDNKVFGLNCQDIVEDCIKIIKTNSACNHPNVDLFLNLSQKENPNIDPTIELFKLLTSLEKVRRRKLNSYLLDDYIAANIDKGDLDYVIPGRKPYEHYFKKDIFGAFVNSMKEKHRIKFKNGSGHELDEHNFKGKLVPPKMASVGSSSRFCYLAFKNREDVEFEVDCKIGDDSTAHLDARIDGNTFVEAKCHEIFTSHKVILKEYYKKLVLSSNFHCIEDSTYKGEKDFMIPLSCFGIDKKSTMFDIKQLICHLLAIKHKKEEENLACATLLYLFYMPEMSDRMQNKDIDILMNDLNKEIRAIFNSTPISSFCRDNNINLKAEFQYEPIMKSYDGSRIIKVYP